MNQKKAISFEEYNLLTKVMERQIPGSSLKEAQGRLIKVCEEKGYLKNGKVTAQGRRVLEPYRAKRAVFLAAGFGSRMVPITLNTPKPLVRIHGRRIIDSLLDATLAAGIEEIYIVRGYLKEQFDQLLYDYPMIEFIDNPNYNETNNISSAMCVLDKFENAYVFESDTLLRNPKLITKYQYTSNYLGVPVEHTDDWCLEVRNGVIKKAQMGGTNCYHWIGVSYWDKESGQKLARYLPKAYEMPGGKERLWDMTPLDIFRQEFKVMIRECSEDEVVEVDNLRELQALDPSYRT